MTLAPETIGAMAIIPELRARGAVVAAGHSLATASLTEQAVQRGITLVTSMFHSTHSVLAFVLKKPPSRMLTACASCHVILGWRACWGVWRAGRSTRSSRMGSRATRRSSI